MYPELVRTPVNREQREYKCKWFETALAHWGSSIFRTIELNSNWPHGASKSIHVVQGSSVDEVNTSPSTPVDRLSLQEGAYRTEIAFVA